MSHRARSQLSGAIIQGVLIMSALLASRYRRTRWRSPPVWCSNSPTAWSTATVPRWRAVRAAVQPGECAIKQSLAITGSVNQLGQSQANRRGQREDEGFFDICKARGLPGTGRLIPVANIKHLMLRRTWWRPPGPDSSGYMRRECRPGHLLLTALPAGEANAKGIYPWQCQSARADRLHELTEIRKSFVKQSEKKNGREEEAIGSTNAKRTKMARE